MAETPRKPGPGRQNAFRRLALGPGREKTHFRLRFGAIRADRGPKIVNFGRAGPRSGRPGAGRPTRDVPPAVPALPRPLRPLRSPSQKSPPPPVKNHETMYHNHVIFHMGRRRRAFPCERSHGYEPWLVVFQRGIRDRLLFCGIPI